MREKYWAFALPIIQKAHGEHRPFCNVCPSKSNSVNGYFGIGKFSLCCVAKYDEARAEIVFQKENKRENKIAFDILYTHKAGIESALGISLLWHRNDSGKSSKIYTQLTNVSIMNDTDWLRMANFHAEWTKKFYDVMIPYLKEEYQYVRGSGLLADHRQI